MQVLPIWLQWAVSLATVLSSIGVFIALMQLKISGDQFKQQLKLNESQFKLVNQGFIQISYGGSFYTNKNLPAQEADILDPETIYTYLFPTVTLKNVGILPVLYHFEHFIAFFDGIESYRAPAHLFNVKNNILFSNQELPLMLGQVYFNYEHTNLTFQEIQELKLTFQLKLSYHDYNEKETNKKIIDQQVALSGVLFVNQNKEDDLSGSTS